jgi:hypothetical protein
MQTTDTNRNLHRRQSSARILPRRQTVTNRETGRESAIINGKLKYLCDWCKRPMPKAMWIVMPERWCRYIKPEQRKDYICKSCWNKIDGMEDRHKIDW